MNDSSVQPAAPRPLTIALVGNPNCGKTTLFNALTGMRQKVANYPGITVARKVGRVELGTGNEVQVVDLPGTYSLLPQSPDEDVTCQVVRGLRDDTPAPDAIVAVADASNITRTLYLVSQLRELGRPMVVALTMSDVAKRRGLSVDVEALSAGLGVPVIALSARSRDGIDALRAAMARLVEQRGQTSTPPGAVAIPEALHKAQAYLVWRGLSLDQARRLLCGDTLRDLDGLRQAHAKDLAEALHMLSDAGLDPVQAEVESRYRWIDALVARCAPPRAPANTYTDRVDAVLMHPILGMFMFAVVMTALFASIFWLATPLMDLVGGGIEALGAWIGGYCGDGLLYSLVTNGLVLGVGTVLKFAPQIALLFMFLALLEDSGYLARAAFLMDRVLGRIGLHGRSFVPLLSSFACAIPGILATSTIANPRERLATIFVAPFMSCSARIPVYMLLVSTCFAAHGALVQGLIVLGCYVVGILAAVVTSLLLRGLRRREERSAFILELPTYQIPQLSGVLRQIWRGTSEFISKAGTIILAISVILWALMTFPRLSDERIATVRAQAELRFATAHASASAAATAADASASSAYIAQAVDSAKLEYSAAGRIGHAIEPLIAPLGFDWKIGVGVVAAFAAREVFVSTLGIVYSVGAVADDRKPLEEAMLADRRRDGTPIWTPAVAISLLTWFVLAMQCMSTLAVVRRETGGWGWPLAQMLWMTALAWGGAWVAYRIALAAGGGA